jgi:hypothetical protein
VIQYANDTILIMKACDSQLVALVSLKWIYTNLAWFQSMLNMNGPAPLLLWMDVLLALSLSPTLDCLWVWLNPWSRTMPHSSIEIERRMSATSQYVSYAGRLQLVNFVLSSLPTCHTRLSEENQVHTYMHARIKFHAYSDI